MDFGAFSQNNLPHRRPNLALDNGGRIRRMQESESSTTAGICHEGGFRAWEANQTVNPLRRNTL
jgi:hypothetical protein